MTLESDLDGLQSRGVVFSVEGHQLRFRGPKGSLTEADRAWLGERRDEVIAALRARARKNSETLALSANQQSVWMTERLTPGTAGNYLASAVRICAPLNAEASRATLQHLLDRHAMLRTTFHIDENGDLFQRTAGSAAANIDVYDARDLSEAELRAQVERERERPFDLETGPLIRLNLYRTGDSEHVKVLLVHHIVSDGHSMTLLMQQIITLWMAYVSGETVTLPPLRASYADHVRRERDLLDGPDSERLWTYWRDELQDAPTEVPLVGDRPAGAGARFRGETVDIALPETLVQRLTRLARDTGVTPFALYLTLFELFLARLSGTTDIVVGTSFSDRAADSDDVVGDYVNALPVRARLRWSMTVRQALVQQQSVVHAAIEAQAYPVQRLIERLRPERSAHGWPLFNCYFNFGHLPAMREWALLLSGVGEGVTVNGVRLMPFPVSRLWGPFDLTLSLGQADTLVMGSIDYPADLFDRAEVEGLRERFIAFLEWAADHPDDTLLPQEERLTLLERFNDTTRDLDQRPFVNQLRERAEGYADRVALRYKSDALTYRELLGTAHGLARRLRAAGAARGTVVGVSMERSPAMLAALLAVQETGAGYLPLDPSYPADRLAFMLADSGAALLVCDEGRPDWAPPQMTVIMPDPADASEGAGEPLPEGPRGGDLAYLIYTSGSTGRPNGVRILHSALSNYLGSMMTEPGIAEADVFAAVSTISFDVAVLELFGPLLVGATIDLLPREIAGNGEAIAARCAEAGATILQATPTLWRQIVDGGWHPAPGFMVFSGGESLPADLAAALLARGVTLWNLYGPTETTIHSAISRITDAAEIDVGRPIANTRIYVLDAHGDPVPIGVEGDIWIGGEGLAQAYHNRPDLTAERFRPDPFSDRPGARMYRTGDIGRWRDNGTLIHLGRSDDQIKLRGFRIEPAEIEAVLMERADVARAIVVPRASGEDTRLAAFLVFAAGEVPTSSELRRHVRERLPEYMVPAMFVDIAETPQMPNGKIDRRGLPNPFAGAQITRAKGTLNGPLEHSLAEIWQEALGLEQVGPGDNFFELGGHSLLAVKVATVLRRRTQHQLEPEMLFFHNLRDIATALDEKTAPARGVERLRQAWRNRSRPTSA